MSYQYYSTRYYVPHDTESLLKTASASGIAEGSYVERLGNDSEGLWIRSFLIKPGVRNARGWGVDSSTALQNVYSIVGKPLVLYRDPVTGKADHPSWNHHYSADANMKNQSRDAIGVVKKVFYDPNTDAYFADSLVTDKAAIEHLNSFTDRRIPIPVSPQIVYDPNKNLSNWYDKWSFSHLAVVNAAAYPSNLARVIETCNGNEETCHKKLQRAVIAAASASASASGYVPKRDTSSPDAFLSSSMVWAPPNGKHPRRLA
jgi:hypothetical protein